MKNSMNNQIKFWCQKVLPLVYDDSLSYYEVLCKVVAKINELISANETLQQEWEQFKNEFNTNLEQVVTNILNEWKEDGYFDVLLEQLFQEKFDELSDIPQYLPLVEENVFAQCVPTLAQAAQASATGYVNGIPLLLQCFAISNASTELHIIDLSTGNTLAMNNTLFSSHCNGAMFLNNRFYVTDNINSRLVSFNSGFGDVQYIQLSYVPYSLATDGQKIVIQDTTGVLHHCHLDFTEYNTTSVSIMGNTLQGIFYDGNRFGLMYFNLTIGQNEGRTNLLYMLNHALTDVVYRTTKFYEMEIESVNIIPNSNELIFTHNQSQRAVYSRGYIRSNNTSGVSNTYQNIAATLPLDWTRNRWLVYYDETYRGFNMDGTNAAPFSAGLVLYECYKQHFTNEIEIEVLSDTVFPFRFYNAPSRIHIQGNGHSMGGMYFNDCKLVEVSNIIYSTPNNIEPDILVDVVNSNIVVVSCTFNLSPPNTGIVFTYDVNARLDSCIFSGETSSNRYSIVGGALGECKVTIGALTYNTSAAWFLPQGGYFKSNTYPIAFLQASGTQEQGFFVREVSSMVGHNGSITDYRTPGDYRIALSAENSIVGLPAEISNATNIQLRVESVGTTRVFTVMATGNNATQYRSVWRSGQLIWHPLW